MEVQKENIYVVYNPCKCYACILAMRIFFKEQDNVPSPFLTKFWFDMIMLPSGSELYFT